MMKTDQKKSVFSMALQNLKAKKFRSGFMIFFVMLMTATFFFSTVLMTNLEMGIKNTTDRMGADIIVAPKEGTEGIKQSLFAGKPISVFMDKGFEETTKAVEGVAKVSPQLYLATLDASCCDAAVQLIAFVPETDFVVSPWLKSNSEKNVNLELGEVVVGAAVNSNVGDTVTFYETEFQVAGKLEQTGMGYDSSVFMTFETAMKLKESDAAKVSMKTEDLENQISMLVVDLEDDITGMSRIAVQRKIENARPDQPAVAAYKTDDLVSGISKQVEKLSGYGNILTALMVVSTALALICIFVITMNERKYEFGILYALGATKGFVTALILVEAWIISILGGILGVLFAGYGMTLFKDMISIKLDIPYLNLSISQLLPIAGIGLLIALVTGSIAAICSAYRMSKGEPYRLIKEA